MTIALLMLCASFTLAAELPGELLRNGMQLTYSSNGKSLPPWTIQSVDADLSYDGMSGCTKTEVVYGNPDDRETKWECISDNLLHVHDGERWIPTRPIGEHMRFGNYETHESAIQELGGFRLKTVKTIRYNYNGDGTIKNRLREYYSVGLGTATEGVFEIPAWTPFNTFKLISISQFDWK